MHCHIVDYGTGNIQSIQNALEHLGHTVKRITSPNVLSNCDCVIFPGQGAFEPAIKTLAKHDWVTPLTQYIQENRPFLGICLGFQLVFQRSDESKNTSGLGCFDGTFKRFNTPKLSVPHMGWNHIQCEHSHAILAPFHGHQFYFVHSFYLPSNNTSNECITDYGHPFVSAVARDHQLLTQFHPEKSGESGLKLIRHFLSSL